MYYNPCFNAPKKKPYLEKYLCMLTTQSPNYGGKDCEMYQNVVNHHAPSPRQLAQTLAALFAGSATPALNEPVDEQNLLDWIWSHSNQGVVNNPQNKTHHDRICKQKPSPQLAIDA